VVRDDPVQLLGHPPVEAPEPRLDVAHREVELRGREGPREGGVRVPVHEDDVRVLLLEDLLELDQHLPGLAGVGPGADVEVVVRLRDVEDLEEHVAHRLVVVLARVDQDLLVVAADLPAHGGRLHELGPRADDARDAHRRERHGASLKRLRTRIRAGREP
jgi:hypothetical protein